MRPIRLAVLTGCLVVGGLPARGATQYWDASTNAGYQHGDGAWTTSPADANWTTNGITLAGWADGSGAYFSGTGGRSGVRVDATSVGSAGLVANGSKYEVVVTNGGLLAVTGGLFHIGYAAASAVGYTAGASNNSALVAGSGSLWDAGGQNLSIGTTAMTGNVLTIDQGGRVDQVNLLLVATNNAVDVRGGTLVAGRIGYTNASALAIGDGAQDAALVLTNRALSGFSPGLRIESRAALQGSARMECGPAGLVVAGGGTLSPGLDGIGCFTNIGTAALEAGSETRLELAAATAPGTGWDVLAVTNGTLALGGLLKPALRPGFVPAKADRFVILTNQGPGSVSGSFDNASDGQAIAVTGGEGESQVGWMTVEIGPQGVALSGYRESRGSGTVLFIR